MDLTITSIREKVAEIMTLMNNVKTDTATIKASVQALVNNSAPAPAPPTDAAAPAGYGSTYGGGRRRTHRKRRA